MHGRSGYQLWSVDQNSNVLLLILLLQWLDVLEGGVSPNPKAIALCGSVWERGWKGEYHEKRMGAMKMNVSVKAGCEAECYM